MSARRIVVIEDDPSIRTLVEAILGSEGYDVKSTGDPRTAADLVKATAPDLVLCDIAMPELDGYGVLKALQADPATARYPVVFLTAHREFSERVRAFRYGVVDYLAKPFSRKILLRKVERVLQGLDRREVAAPVTEGRPPTPREVLDRAGRAELEEMEAPANEVEPHDPARLTGEMPVLPSFDAVPAVLRHVLLVDDNPEFRSFLRDILRRCGFTIHEAADGEEAFRVLLERRPLLVITDLRMEGMDGLELCRKVRSHSLVRQTPVLFLSGMDDYAQRYRGLEAGADDFLSKSTSIRELLLRIQLLLARYANLGERTRGSGMQGHLHVLGVPGVLHMCHLGRLTGTLSAQDGARRVSLRFRDGEIVGAEGEGARDAEAVYAFVGWTRGAFDFAPGNPGPGEPLGETFDQLLLEACRRLDEASRSLSGPQ